MISVATSSGCVPDPEPLDFLVRAAAFEFLTEQGKLYGESLPRKVLLQGFLYGDRRVPLMGRREYSSRRSWPRSR